MSDKTSIKWMAIPGYPGYYVTEMGQVRGPSFKMLVKQLGAQPVTDGDAAHPGKFRLDQANRKGGDITEWPADLRVREFPVMVPA